MIMDTNLAEFIISQMQTVESVETVSDLADRLKAEGLQVTKGLLYQARRRGTISLELVVDYAELRNLDLNWLILGTDKQN